MLAPFAAAASGALGAASAIAPAVGTYYERSFQNDIDRSDPNVAQKTFAPKVRQVYDLFGLTLESFTTNLFAGKLMENDVSLCGIVEGWVLGRPSSPDRVHRCSGPAVLRDFFEID